MALREAEHLVYILVFLCDTWTDGCAMDMRRVGVRVEIKYLTKLLNCTGRVLELQFTGFQFEQVHNDLSLLFNAKIIGPQDAPLNGG